MASNCDRYRIFPVSLIASLILGMSVAAGHAPFTLVPLAAALPASAWVFTHRKDRIDPNRILNGSPAAIGMMSVRISSGGSLDTAVRDVSENGPECIADMFRSVVRRSDLSAVPGIKHGLNEMVNGLPAELSSFKRSVRMVISASEADGGERMRMLKDAERTSLAGMRDMGESYGSSLNNPCMLIFGIGIMVPMTLMSVMPMLNVGGVFSVPFLTAGSVALVTLVLVPCFIGLVALAVAAGDPFSEDRGRFDVMTAVPLLSAVPLYLAASRFLDIGASILVSAAAAGAVTSLAVRRKVSASRRRRSAAEGLNDSLFDIGSMLMSGQNFESSLISSLKARAETEGIARDADVRMRMSRGDVGRAVRESLSPYSGMLADSYDSIYRISVRNARDSGRVAVSLAHHIQDQENIKRGIENRMKGMKDMMLWTAAVFAPLIMGLSVVLMGPLSSVSGMDARSVSPLLSLYLIELSLIISVLVSYLGGRSSHPETVFRFGTVMPVSLVVFSVVSGLSI